MAKRVSELTTLEVKHLGFGTHNVGGVPGLYLKKTPHQSMFFLRYTDFTGRHDFSLGSFPFTTLAQARRKALETWGLIKNWQSPIELRKREKQERLKALQEEQRNRALLTFKTVAEEWIADRVKHNYWAKNPRGEKTTRGVLQKHVYPTLGDISIEEITPEMVRDCLAPIWQDLTATAKKAKSYMHKIFQWAIATHKRQNRENPTSFDGAFGVLIEPLQNNLKPTKNHAACAVEEIPQLFAEMHAYGSMSAMACMFAILTASRSQAVRLAKWDEIDFKNRIWTIPVEHDKVKSPNRDRTIFLSSSALRLLERVPRFNDSPFIFPSRQGGHFSDVAFTMFLRGLHAKRLTQTQCPCMQWKLPRGCAASGSQ